jgi:pseudaminic acid cytidylyltransferase
MTIAVIPARGGSKRIPRKNIKYFAGRPMIAWSIRVAQESELFDHILVSTDDEEIAQTATAMGAEIPFRRPMELADDLTPTVPVVAHAVRACNSFGWNVKYACCLYPCAPFVNVSDLVEAFRLIDERKVDFVYPVAEYAHPIQRAMRQLPNGKMELYTPQFELTRTQDLEPSYHDAGQFYWGTASAWLAGKKMHTDGIGMPIPKWRVVDIDSEDDWVRASLIYKSVSEGEKS